MGFFFLFLFGILVTGNAYVILRLLQCFPVMPSWGKTIVWGVMFSPIVLFILSFLLSKVGLPYNIVRICHLIGSSWLFFILYMVIGLLLVDLLRIWVSIPYNSSFIILVATLLVLLCGYLNYKSPKINSVDIKLQGKNLSSAMRVVAISDVHLGYGTTNEQLKQFIELTNEQTPDLIIIGGDLIDNSVEPLYQEDMVETLSLLKAPMGVYMVPGNHEYISGIEKCQDLFSSTNIVFLKDSIVILPNGVQIVGRDDRFNNSRSSLQELMNNVNLSSPVIVLDHQPNEVDLVEQLGIDLQFSGHTHRGQVWPISWITDLLFPQSYGYRKWGESHVYVSSGLSLWGPPFRVGTNSELVVLNIASGN
ncbi:MAG: metallophosphoesterase [Paludibacteraceae bacterium]|nr:metallophosphoesterase [Paludibacteraceae bacterium]